MCTMCAYCLHWSEEGTGSYGGRVMGGCELPHQFRETNSGLLQEQQVLLTAEPTLESIRKLKKKNPILPLKITLGKELSSISMRPCVWFPTSTGQPGLAEHVRIVSTGGQRQASTPRQEEELWFSQSSCQSNDTAAAEEEAALL